MLYLYVLLECFCSAYIDILDCRGTDLTVHACESLINKLIIIFYDVTYMYIYTVAIATYFTSYSSVAQYYTPVCIYS